MYLKHIGSVVAADSTIFECGIFSDLGGDWLVVVAGGGVGNQASQSAVQSAQFTFAKFDAVIFVGVGGSRKDEAPIGSVVAANRIYSPYSGKFEDGEFYGRPRVIEIQHRLVEFARKICRDRVWHKRIPAPVNGEWPPQGEYPKPFPPSGLVAAMVSVEAVSADKESALERLIKTQYNDACAVEMEGYGAAFAAGRAGIPCIVLRGISDMASNKTPEADLVRQPVAAVHAAAFGFELLSMLGQVGPAIQPPPISNPSLDSGPTANTTPTTIDGQTCRLVINFDGQPEDFPAEKVAAILDAIKSVTGNRGIRIIRSEPGSFRLIIEAKVSDKIRIESEEFQRHLSATQDINLLGVFEEGEFRRIEHLKQTLDPPSQELLNWPRTLPGGISFERPELDRLLQILTTRKHSSTVVLGKPGSGKSALLASLGASTRALGWPVLAIKADLLGPALRSEHDLQNWLGLDNMPSEVALRIAAAEPVLLIIDQLDAIAGYVDVKTGRLNILLNLVRRLGKVDNVHVVLSARAFEYEHDVRLRSIAAESIELELPPWSLVSKVLQGKGFRPDGWSADAKELLRSPQALSIFLQLSGPDSEPYRKYHLMLESLWSERILKAHNGPRLAQLISDIASAMADEESLWLAAARYDKNASDIRALMALGILSSSESGGSIGFTHQTLFDHALARRFAQGKGRLSAFVRSRQASLFVRPKLWAALTYLRDAESASYEDELQAIWGQPNLRAHLKLLLIDFMGQQDSPSQVEFDLLSPVLAWGPDRQFAYRAIAGSAGWFKRLAATYIPDAMTESEPIAWVLTRVLSAAWAYSPGEVVGLLRERWGNRSQFDRQFWAVLFACRAWTEEVALLAESLLLRSETEALNIDYLVSVVGVGAPDIAIRLVHAKLNSDFETAKREIETRRASAPEAPSSEDVAEHVKWTLDYSLTRPLRDLLDNGAHWNSIPALAESSPSSFLRVLWPWFISVLSELRKSNGNGRMGIGFGIPYEGDFRFETEDNADLPERQLLEAMRTAVEQVAARSPAEFLKWVQSVEHEDATPVQRLIAHGLASQPKEFAKRSLSFLLDDERRFLLGGLQDMSGTTKRLIRAASPYWSQEELDTLERAVLSYSPSPTSTEDAQARREFGRTIRAIRLDVLKALPAERIGDKALRLIEEESRVFPDPSRGMKLSGVQTIGSPMETSSMELASDEQIVNAFKTFPDETDWGGAKRWNVGGNIQLSRAFAEFAKKEPERAMRIVANFQVGTGERGAGYALEAIADTAQGELVIDNFLALRKRGFDSSEFRTSTARAIERLVGRDVVVRDEVVRVFEEWLERPPADDVSVDESKRQDGSDQEIDTATRTARSDDTDEGARSVLWGYSGYSVLPHGNYPSLEVIVRMLLARDEHDRLVDVLRRHMERAEKPEVWQALLRYWIYLRPSTPSVRADLLKTLFGKYSAIARTREAVHLLAHAQWWAPELVTGTIESWSSADERWLRQAYGELTALIALCQPGVGLAGTNLQNIVSNPDAVDERLGATHTAVHLWSDSPYRVASTRLITSVLSEADPRLWAAVFELFGLVEELLPEPSTLDLLNAIAENINNAPRQAHTLIVDRLETLLPNAAVLVGRIARGLVARWREDLGDTRTGIAMTSPQLVDLAITLHRMGSATRELGIQLFEELLLANAHTARETLDEIDGRMNMEDTLPRPRLRRRPSRRSRRSNQGGTGR